MAVVWIIVAGFVVVMVVLLVLKPKPNKRGRRGESLIEDHQLDPR